MRRFSTGRSCSHQLKMRRLVLLGALALAACGGDSTAPSASMVGTWELQSVNGFKIPGQLLNEHIYSGQFVIRSDGTFTQTYHAAYGCNLSLCPVDVLHLGIWVEEGELVTFKYDPPGDYVFRGTHKGNTLTVDIGGVKSVYVRH